MMKTLLFSLTCALVAFLGFAGASSAATIDCSTAGCLGGTYTLEITDDGGGMYTAMYTVDTSGPYSVSATHLVDAEFKVANTYTKAPTITMTNADGTLGAGPLAGKGCKGGKNDSFMCITLDDPEALGGTYSWKVTFGTDQLLEESDWHVGARYISDGSNGSKPHSNGWLISESPGEAVPEPTAALLFGAGIFVVGSVTRRRAR